MRKIKVADFLRKVADERHEIHKGHETSRPLSKDYELVGLAGEYAFAKIANCPVDLLLRPEGDGGVDFYTQIGTIDVKTARKPYHLLREVGKPRVDILVLAGYSDEDSTAWLLGWEYDKEMVKCPVRDFGYGVINHYKPAYRLRPISDLLERISWAKENA